MSASASITFVTINLASYHPAYLVRSSNAIEAVMP